MQRLEVSGAVRPLQGLLGVKGLNFETVTENFVKWRCYSFLLQSVSRQVCCHFQSERSTECDPVLLLSISNPHSSLRSSSSCLRLTPPLPVPIFPSKPCFTGQFLHKAWAICLSFPFILHSMFRIYGNDYETGIRSAGYIRTRVLISP